MGELTFFLGLQVKQKEDGIFISQDKYVGEILKKFGFSSVRRTSTPMETNKALTKDKDGEDVDVHLYRSMIGSLMYLTSSRPDIMFSVCACLRFQVQPKVSHLNAVKRIFRYLKGQPKLGLWYPKDSPLTLEAFSDSDYAGANLDNKYTIGVKTITEASLRRHLKLEDNGGVTTLPNSEIFEQLALMGYVTDSDKLTFQKGHFYPQWKGEFNSYYPPCLKPIENCLGEHKVKKLKQKLKSTQARRRIRIVVSDDEKGQEDLSKQGRKITEINQDPSISLVQDEGISWIQEDIEIQEKISVDLKGSARRRRAY
ncbi:hypothetical protein Tco_1111590 [Tanacetum coccineum]|uniref:Reverse transcriptase Ty1/copia-type domain-containing protein n=1 Tax=Tanacetum coccineum TaxID=301880 RepID=A0ABQ5IM51_9ASTR